MNRHSFLASIRRMSPLAPYLVALAVGGLAFVGAFLANRIDRRETRAHAEVDLGELVRLKAVTTVGFIDRIAQSLRFVAYLRERDGLDFDLRALVAEGRLDAADVLQFSFVDAEGIVRRSNLPLGPVPVSVADRAHFRAVAVEGEALHIGRPVLGRVSGHWSLQIVREIRTEREGFLGAAMASVDVAALGRLLDLPDMEATIALVGADGVVRTRTGLERGHLGEADLARSWTARFRAADSGAWESVAAGNDDRLVTLWRKLDAYPLYVTATLPIRKLTADADRRAPFYWAAAACVALGAILIAFVYANRRARAEAALEAAHAADAAKTRLLVSLNAELRRPVDMLRWSIDTLADSPDEIARRRALADLRRADAALGRAVNDAAELARLMREAKELDLRAVDARLFARHAFEAARGRASGAGVTCDLALDLPEGLRVLTDETRLRRMADALLGAAVDRAGRDGRVGFSVGARGLDAHNVEIAIAVSASSDSIRSPAPESGMAAALAQAMGGRLERLASPGGTLDVFKVGLARAA
jgi:signal transduction histidine kinase